MAVSPTANGTAHQSHGRPPFELSSPFSPPAFCIVSLPPAAVLAPCVTRNPESARQLTQSTQAGAS